LQNTQFHFKISLFFSTLYMRYYTKPDLNAPRYRHKRYNIINDDFIKRLYEKYPGTKKYKSKEIRKIIGDLNEKMWNLVIDTRDGVELPNNLGWIFVGSCQRPTKYNKDFNKSNSYNSDIRHRNYESDEKLAKIFYSNYAKKYLFKNRDLWTFTAHRNFSRTTSKKFKDNWNRYIQIDKTKHITAIMKKEKYKELIAKSSIIPDDYNEFKLD